MYCAALAIAYHFHIILWVKMYGVLQMLGVIYSREVPSRSTLKLYPRMHSTNTVEDDILLAVDSVCFVAIQKERDGIPLFQLAAAVLPGGLYKREPCRPSARDKRGLPASCSEL